MDDVQYENTLEMIDRLMASGKLSKGQWLYLEVLHVLEAGETRGQGVKAGGNKARQKS